MLMQEHFYYKANQEEIIKDHLGEYVVIQGNSVLGYYPKLVEALDDMADKNVELETFAVRKCRPVGISDMSVTDLDFEVVSAWKH
jgi:uncharacterized Rossmann fold enzyme